DQWHRLQHDFQFDTSNTTLPACGGIALNQCASAAALGQKLFFEPRFSFESYPPPTDPPHVPVSCATCHDPMKWFIDSRSVNDVSAGAIKLPGRNSMTLVNAAFKTGHGDNVFTWAGTTAGPFPTAGSVTALAVAKPMATTVTDVEQTVMNCFPAE